MSPETVGIILGSGFAVINVSAFWVREWKKHRTWSKNGKDLTEIKADVKDVKGKVDGVKTDVTKIKTLQDAQTKVCESTVRRFDNALLMSQKELLEIAKGK